MKTALDRSVRLMRVAVAKFKSQSKHQGDPSPPLGEATLPTALPGNGPEIGSQKETWPSQSAREGAIITGDKRLASQFRGRLVKTEVVKTADGSEETLYHVSFGWKDPSLADLDGVRSSISDSKDIFYPIRDEFVAGLKAFEAELANDWTLTELQALSPHLRDFSLVLNRDHFRFFFITSFMEEGSLLVTVFLEATPQELLGRPPHYANADKNLFTTYFSEDGVVRRTDSEFEAEAALTRSVESTAYAKFYIDTWGKECNIDILIHPMQKARLLHTPERDMSFASYRRRVRDLGGVCKKKLAALKHLEKGIPESELNALSSIADTLILLSQHVDKRDFLEKAPEWRAQLETLRRQLFPRECYEIPQALRTAHTPPESVDPSLARPRRPIPLTRRIHDAVKHTVQVEHILRKAEKHTEAPYAIADKITGNNRELLFLAVSQLLRDCLEEHTRKVVTRFMLSSQQIDRIRLFRASDKIRERIREVPLRLEKHYATEILRRQLLRAPASPKDPYPKTTEPFPLSVILLD